MDQQFATDWLQVACPVYKVKDWIKSIKFCLQWFKLVDCPVHRKNYYQVESTHWFNKRRLYTSFKRFNLTLSFTSQQYTLLLRPN